MTCGSELAYPPGVWVLSVLELRDRGKQVHSPATNRRLHAHDEAALRVAVCSGHGRRPRTARGPGEHGRRLALRALEARGPEFLPRCVQSAVSSISGDPANALGDGHTAFLNSTAWKTYANPAITQTLGTLTYVGNQDVGGNLISGNINVLGLVGNSIDAFVLGLKGSNSASFYSFSGGASANFAFSMIGSATNPNGASRQSPTSPSGSSRVAAVATTASPATAARAEPSSYGLALAGLAALGVATIRRRRRSV